MDHVVDAIAGYAAEIKFADLSPQAVHHAKRCVVDSFGVALGALDAEPATIARNLAQRGSVTQGSRLIGSRGRVLPELAAFANGVMIRYLDANDSFLGAGGHPSDCIAPILAAADLSGADGQSIITAIVLTYEVYYNLWKSAPVRRKGLDNSFYPGVASALGAAKVLGLDRARIVEALSLAITPNLPLNATRHGHLSMWKGCASGNAARNALFAALLAQAGMTGPEKPIEGGHGLQNLCGEFELMPFPKAGGDYAIAHVMLKSFASVAHAMSPITVALGLAGRCPHEKIRAITIHTYQYAWEMAGREREKWRPTTREAADHSLPYIVAAVLIEGDFNVGLFDEDRLNDPRIRTLIDKIEVKPDPEISARFPKQVPCRIEVEFNDGTRTVGETDYPRGHANNPMTDEEVNAKFRSYAGGVRPDADCQKTLAALWKLESAANLDAALTPLER
jgi:2-methylcitrate dehydratase